jgi:hypothetical protein
MNTIATIFGYLFLALLGIFALMLFIQTNMDLWNEIGKDWWKTTKMGMKISNKRNGVTILTDQEYEQMLYGGQIKHNITINK